MPQPKGCVGVLQGSLRSVLRTQTFSKSDLSASSCNRPFLKMGLLLAKELLQPNKKNAY